MDNHRQCYYGHCVIVKTVWFCFFKLHKYKSFSQSTAIHVRVLTIQSSVLNIYSETVGLQRMNQLQPNSQCLGGLSVIRMSSSTRLALENKSLSGDFQLFFQSAISQLHATSILNTEFIIFFRKNSCYVPSLVTIGGRVGLLFQHTRHFWVFPWVCMSL